MKQTTELVTQVADRHEAINQYLTFMLGSEEYGLEILRVQEIKGFSAITPIPNTPPHIKGVMNLRGTVVPVLDLRMKFALAKADYNQFTVIIVVNVGSKVTGLVVDAVSDVLDVPANDIDPAPEMGGADVSFLRGLAKSGDRLIALLDIDKVAGLGIDLPASGMAAE